MTQASDRGRSATWAVTRRTALRGAALSAAALLSASSGPIVALAAAPTPLLGGTPVSFTPILQVGLWDAHQTAIVMDALWTSTEAFRKAHPGIKLIMGSEAPNLSIVDFTSGTAPDIVLGYDEFSAVANNGYLLNLNPYLTAGNSPLDVWSRPNVEGFNIAGNLYALPYKCSTTAMVANFTLADDLGLKRPEAGWTWDDWTAYWRATTVKSSKRPRAGGGVYFAETGVANFYFRGWGGNIMDPSEPTRCLLTTSAANRTALATLPLVQDGVCVFNQVSGGQVENILTGTQASMVYWGAALAATGDLLAMTEMSKSMAWDFLPMPLMPSGRFEYTQRTFRAISALTKHAEAAWEVLHWLEYDPAFQRVLMRFGNAPPALKSLQEEYIAGLANVVPALRSKNLQAVISPILDDATIPEPEFPYFPSEARQQISFGEYNLTTGHAQADITGALTTLARQVDALEAAGVAGTAQIAKISAQLSAAAAHPEGAVLSPPETSGVGQPPQPGGAALAVQRGRTFVVTSSGQGLDSAGDNGTFFYTSSTAAEATFTCRIVSMSATGKGGVPAGAKAGLVARGDLSSLAADVFFGIAGQRGVHFSARPLPGTDWQDQRPGGGTGLLAAATILTGGGQTGNNLLKPVWLRLVRRAGLWSAQTSTDGTAWLAAGTPMGIKAAGVWIGLFVTAHDAALSQPVAVTATFDHVDGFLPAKAVIL